MKRCTKCNSIKTSGHFRLRNALKRRLQSWCKSCMSIYDKEYFQINKTRKMLVCKKRRDKLRFLLKEYLLDKKCKVCLERDVFVLEFDHRNPKEKRFDVGAGVSNGYSWDTILKEIAKCNILCANCHRRKTIKQLGWYKAAFDKRKNL